jgi:hypothetical protein
MRVSGGIYREMVFICLTGYGAAILHIVNALIARLYAVIFRNQGQSVRYVDTIFEVVHPASVIYALVAILISCIVASMLCNSNVRGNWTRLLHISWLGLLFSVVCFFLATPIGGFAEAKP